MRWPACTHQPAGGPARTAHARQLAHNATAASLREAWRWVLEPVGEEGEMLVLFDHAGEGARDGDERDTDMEVRAAVMNTSFGRGLYTTGTVQKGQNIGWYDGDNITEEQYCKLTEETGLRHTLEAPGNTLSLIHI